MTLSPGFVSASSSAASQTYTTNADFDLGTLEGVNHDAVPDQLQLDRTTSTFPFAWIANSGDATVSKFNTRTNREVARYRTWFGPSSEPGWEPGSSWSGAAPSRTAVDGEGNVYVANRHFDGRPGLVIKILMDGWIDRNGNGIIDTSVDTNNDGTIGDDEILSMGDTNGNGKIDDSEIKDERIAWAVPVGPANGLARSLAIAPDGNIWVGLYNDYSYYELSSSNGAIASGPINVYPHTPYGALVDRDGILWGASLSGNLLRLDTKTHAVKIYDHWQYGSNYGIALGNGHIYLASQWGYSYIEFDPSTESFSIPATTKFASLGVAVDRDGNIIVGNSSGGAAKFAPDGSLIWSASPQPGTSEVRGVVVDADNDVWLVHRADNCISKHRGTDGAPLGVLPTGAEPYTYTDATGLAFRTNTTKTGTWNLVKDSGTSGLRWGTVSWNDYVPSGASVEVKVRTADSTESLPLATYQPVANGVEFSSSGRYIQIQVRLTANTNGDSPILYDLTVESSNRPPVISAPDITVDEGQLAVNTITVQDDDGDSVAVQTSIGSVGPNPTSEGKTEWQFQTSDGPIETQEITISADDGNGGRADGKFTLTVNNVAPTIRDLTIPTDPIPINTPISVSANFTDPGTKDTHSATWSWDNGANSPGTVNETNGAGSVTGSYIYATPGVYQVKLEVVDKDGGVDTETALAYVVVYDPNAGFVTGGGWIDSPPGAYTPNDPDDPDVTGRASFGFVSKYLKGAKVPTGNTEFQFHSASLNFHSDSYEWLVVSGVNGYKAQYKGTGTVNGSGDYGFILTCIDGQNNGTNIDKFRIKIWDKNTNDLIYDNQVGLADTTDPAMAITNGNIVIHVKK